MPAEEVRFTFRLPAAAARAIQVPDPGSLRGGVLLIGREGREVMARIEDVTADDDGLLITMMVSDPVTIAIGSPGGGPPMGSAGPECYSPVTSTPENDQYGLEG